MSDCFRFGDFELDPAVYAPRRAGGSIRLERAPMDLLILLVRARGALVTRTDIRNALWDQNVFVDSDAAINTAIRKIRRALGDDAEEPRFVETIVGKGYRFAVPLEQGSEEQRTCFPGFLPHTGQTGVRARSG